MGKQPRQRHRQRQTPNHSNKKVYLRTVIRLRQSIDFYLRRALGFPPWRCNPRFLDCPNPLTLEVCLNYLNGLTIVPESLGIEPIAHDGYTDDESDGAGKCGATAPHGTARK